MSTDQIYKDVMEHQLVAPHIIDELVGHAQQREILLGIVRSFRENTTAGVYHEDRLWFRPAPPESIQMGLKGLINGDDI